jgi:glycosyltransferase involved in cell wall biosynthesis
MARLFFDISDIVTYIQHHSSISGIQRATVMIIAEAVRLQGPENIYLSFLRPDEDTHLCCRATELIETLERFDTVALGAALRLKTKAATAPMDPPFLRRYRNKPLKLAYHRFRLARALRIGDQRYLFKRGIDPASIVIPSTPPLLPTAPRLQPLSEVARPGDTLCGLGAIWGMPNLVTAFHATKDLGLKVLVMVHDLIPMKLPEMADFKAARSYYDWLSETPDYCAGYLANSASTARDLKEFLTVLGVDLPVHVTPLAQAQLGVDPAPKLNSELPAAHATVLARSRAAGAIATSVREAALLPYVLCVGTIEPRKNLWRLTQTWVRMARNPALELPRLVLAGKRGWLTEEFLGMLETTGGMDGWVSFIEAPSDAELAYLYRNCLFTATVSLYEGWGLPIGEGLSYGKTGVVSQTSSMPEVGGDMVVYCDPSSMQSIETAVLRCLDLSERTALETRIARTTLRSWDNVGRDVMAALER